MDDKALTRHSKFLSLVLRHRPELIGIEPDASGWVATAGLLQAMAVHNHPISAEELNEIVMTSPKQRFAFSEDKKRIRANQGHSIAVDLGLEPQKPPAMLFHGTVGERIPAILREGLKKQLRHHVHLSADRETAAIVGGRRGKAVILQIDAAGMQAEGVAFFRSENGVWLTDAVPARFLRLAD